MFKFTINNVRIIFGAGDLFDINDIMNKKQVKKYVLSATTKQQNHVILRISLL